MTSGFQAGGTVTYNWFTGNTCSGTANTVSTASVVSGNMPSSLARTFNSAGPYSWNAVSSGDSNNNGGASSCEPLTVNPTTGITISTTLSSSSITVGGSVADSATLTGVTSGAGGTVTYNSFLTASCTGTPAVVSTVTVTNGAIPGSAAKAFNSAGSFSWSAIYSGDANNGGATSLCEPLTVNQAAPSITTTVSGNNVPIGTLVHDSSTLSNGANAGGTVTYTLFSDAGCTVSGVVVSTVPVTNGVVPDSQATGPPTAGAYSFQASYSGDANNKPVTGACEPFNILKASPGVTTSLSLTTIPVGSSVSDSATMTGGYQPGGIVTYVFFVGSSCTGSSTTVGSPVAVTNGVVPGSAPSTFNSAGAYGWSAVYSGDANNNAVTSSCEPLTVNKTGPVVSTTLSANPVAVGSSVYDSAAMTGAFQAGGSATYFVFTTSDCTGSKTQVSVGSVSNGVIPTSIPQTFNNAGSYSWNLGSAGAANNNATPSLCEPLSVSKASPSISTNLSQNVIVVGGSVSDSATITNGFQASGAVTYSYFTGSTCSGVPTVVGTSVTVSSGSVPGSASQPFNTAGPFSWNAAYSGDANNNIATSACEPLTVNPKGVAIATSLSAATITVGGSVFDSAVLTGATSNAGGTVTYNSFLIGSCTGTPGLVSTVTVTNGAVLGSASKSFNSAGSFSWDAVYSGDANNSPATSLCEPLTVNKATPTLTTTVSAPSAPIGSAFHDSATLTGAFTAGGTVSYNTFNNNVCSGSSTPVGSPVTVASGVVPDSVPMIPPTAGLYSFQASYSGDTNNNAVPSACEPLTVNKALPTITTTLSQNPITVGGSVFDSATIASGFQAGGFVNYDLFTGSTCNGALTVLPAVTVINGQVQNSVSQVFNSAGSYSWNAVYSGDTNNNAATSTCEPLTVNPTSGVAIFTVLSSSTITVGGSVSDSASLTGVASGAGGAVTYNSFQTASCSGTTGVVP